MHFTLRKKHKSKKESNEVKPTMAKAERRKQQPAGCFAFLRAFSKLFKRKKKRAVVNSEGHAKPKDTEEPFRCSPPQEGPASPNPGDDWTPLSREEQKEGCEARTVVDDTCVSTQLSSVDHCGSSLAKVESRYEKEEEESPARRCFREHGVPLLEEQQISQLTNYYQENIGCGSYGWCCRTRVPGTGQEVVVKTFHPHALEDLFTEASVLQYLQVPGVQRLVGVCVETSQMVTCCAGQIAKDFLSSPATRFKDAVSVCLQVARTLRMIHLRGVVHNDIKGNNVCVQVSDQGPIATIIDFGLARTIGTPSVYRPAPACKYPWAAPELLQEDALPCFEESDIYSLAYLIVTSVELRCCSQHCPVLHALCLLLRDALEPQPRARPTLPALIRALEELHLHILAPAPPPARSRTTPTHPAPRSARSPLETFAGGDVAANMMPDTTAALRSTERAGTVEPRHWTALILFFFFGVFFFKLMFGRSAE